MLCSKQRYSLQWKNGKTPGLTKNGKSITCTMDNFVLLAVPGLSSIPAAVCLQHRDQRISEIISENWDCYQIQSRSEVTSMHAGNRCWQILTSRPQETVNQHTNFFQTWCTRRIQRKAFPIGYAHSSEREISEAEGDASKVVTQKWKHSIHTHFRKYRTEEIGDLTTVERKSESRNNQQFACRGTRSHHSVDTTRVKPKLHRRRRRILRKFSEPSQKPKVIYTDDLLQFGKSCEESSWNHRTTTPCRSDEIAERAVCRAKEGTSAVLLQSGLTEKWWSDSMKWYYYLQNDQDFLADGKSQNERRFGESFKGPVIFFDALVGYLTKLRERDKARIHQFAKKLLPRIFLGYALIAGEFGKKKYWLLILKNWKS